MEINFVDNFLSKTEHQRVYQYCLTASYRCSEPDFPGYPPTGITHNISGDQFVYKLFARNIADKFEFLRDRKLYRMYVNCFAPGEHSYFHIDGEEGYTLLYYPNPDWKLDDGGETQFYIDENLQGICPVPNRMAVFEASIMHRATPFRSKQRFTVAIKYY